MKHQTATLTGALLDAAVALACGWPLLEGDTAPSGPLARLSPSTDWAIGGPIIERERISVVQEFNDPNLWSAGLEFWLDVGFQGNTETGHTPLIAAMRAYVAAKLGAEVDLP